jgi:hypothetical protein
MGVTHQSTANATETATRSRHSLGAALWLCVGAVVTSLVLRVLYLAQQWRIDLAMPRAYLAGEGLLGIMARHILRGARPVVHYGQYLNGTFEEYLEASVFALFGETVGTFRLVPTAFSVLCIPLTGMIAARLYGRRAGYLAAALIALPSQFVFEWGFVGWGGHAYLPLILLTIYLLLLTLRRVSAGRLAAVGFVAGFSVWVYQLVAPYVAVYAYALKAWLHLGRREVAIVLTAGLIGLSPLLYLNVVEPLGTARNLAARVRSSWRLGAHLAHQQGDESKFYRSIAFFQVLGAQPRHDGDWSARGSATALLLTLGGVAGAWRARRRRESDPETYRGTMLILGCAVVSVLVGITGFFGQPVARFQLPLYPLLCVLMVGWLEGLSALAVPVTALIVLGNAVQIATPLKEPPRTPNSAVIDALLEHDLHRGYGADNMYDLVFESKERIIIEPLEWTRYRPYLEAVSSSDRVFYLYRQDQERKISYRVFMDYLERQNIQFRRFDVGEYRVLYDFDPPRSLSGQAVKEIRAEIRARKENRAHLVKLRRPPKP